MNKKNVIYRTFKALFLFIYYIFKAVFVIVPGLLKKLAGIVSKQLRFSITFKTTVVYTLIFSTVLLIIGSVLTVSFGYFLIRESEGSLKKKADVVISYIDQDNNTGIPEDRLKKYASIEGVDIAFFNKDKEVIYTTLSDIKNVSFRGRNDISSVLSISSNFVYLNVETGIKDDIYYVTLSKDITQEKTYILMLIVMLSASFLLSILFIIAAGSRTSRRMLKPIDDMIGTARSISASALHTRLNIVDSHDELKELAETFNQMLSRIQDSYEQQNRFVSDASHELRTPISVIQGYANLISRWGKDNKEVLDESVEAIKNESDNMQDLVEKLLFLARADKDTQKLDKSNFSINELVDEVLKETKLIDTQHIIESGANNIALVNADRMLIKQALRIFIDNSIKFTPSGGTIRISSVLKGRKIVLTVEDNGIGIPKEDLPHIFDRFFKCDRSRTRNSGGTGLGLSIAKWIIEKHGGTVGAESIVSKGTKITVVLPSY